MPQENVDLVRRFEECWSRRDLDAAFQCVDAELEFDWSDSIGPSKGIYKGHDGLARFWRDMLEPWERFSPEMAEVIECGPDRLITAGVVRARGKGSGIEMEARGAMLWTLRDGKIARAKMFQTKEDALEAVGLEGRERRAEWPHGKNAEESPAYRPAGSSSSSGSSS
jgi:ketosteroid isomerase-like protein